MFKTFQDLFDWFRSYQKEVILGSIVFVVASLSFGLGYLANRQFNHAPIIIEKCNVMSEN